MCIIHAYFFFQNQSSAYKRNMHKIPKLSMMFQGCISQNIYIPQQASCHILRIKLGPYSFSLSTTITLVSKVEDT